MKLIKNKEHSVRVEITPNELLGTNITGPQNYFENWMNSIKLDNDKWSKKSEESKKAYQKKYFETERMIHELDENDQLSARFHLKLNTDWTWNVIDFKNNVEYEHCYSIGINDNINGEPNNDVNMILQLPLSVVDKYYYYKAL